MILVYFDKPFKTLLLIYLKEVLTYDNIDFVYFIDCLLLALVKIITHIGLYYLI